MESKQKIEFRRNLRLNALSDWCLQRISQLSLSGADAEAQAMTEEHMETLQAIDIESTLWISAADAS